MRSMHIWRRTISLIGSVAVLCALLVFPRAAGAATAAIPFTDANQQGTLTFCNAEKQAITSGSLSTVPFVWSAVSSTSAPAHYTRAYLTLYQPMQYEDPSEWTGYQLTVEALFTNAQHPMAQATYADQPLLWPDQQLPPHWDGLYQVRMFFTQPMMAPYTSSYPAAVIQVTGNSWKLLSGGGSSCNTGSAASYETAVLPKSETEVPHVISASGKTLVAVGSSSSKSGPTTAPSSRSVTTNPASSVTSPGGTSTTTSGSGTRALASGVNGKPSNGSSGAVAAIIVAVVLVVGGSGGMWLRRRRRISRDPTAGGLAG